MLYNTQLIVTQVTQHLAIKDLCYLLSKVLANFFLRKKDYSRQARIIIRTRKEELKNTQLK